MIELWLLLIILSALGFAVLMIGDRFALSRYFKNSITYQALANFGNIILPIFLPFIFNIDWNAPYIFAIIIYGFFMNFLFILLNLALQHEEVSIIGPLNGTIPFFILIFAFFILGEAVNFSQILGIVIMVLATILLTYSSNSKFNLSKGVIYVLIFVVIYALTQIVLKFFITTSDPYTTMYFTVCGGILSGLTLMLSKNLRHHFLNVDLKQPIFAILYFSIGKTLIYAVMIITLYLALSLEKVSLVGAMLQTLQPLFTLILSFIVTQINPSLLNETFDRKTLFLKVIGVTLVCVGIYLIA